MSEPRLEACQGKALALLALVFLIGAGSGVLGHWASAKGAGANPNYLEGAEAVDVEQLRENLDLSDEQFQSVQTILDGSIMVEADLMVRIRNVRHQGREEILTILTEEQRDRFEAMVQRASSY